jgi:hypothetical protein
MEIKMTDLIGKIILGFGLYFFGFYSGMLYNDKNTQAEAIDGLQKHAVEVEKKIEKTAKTVIKALDEDEKKKEEKTKETK